MAEIKVFVSSTCYDLSILRSELRTFITDLGYNPIMSDYADITYNPSKHTHVSCINEVENCDIFVLIIGSRYGGAGIPSALESIDSNILEQMKSVQDYFDNNQISITQLEVAKAVELNIPIYTFIDKKVYYIHEVYEKNKHDPELINKIYFPGIEKQETAQYIFEFINFIRKRSVDNFFFPFENTQNIKSILKKQWAGYFKILLREKRQNLIETKKLDSLNEQFEDLKAAILSSIENTDQQETAKGIVKYRRLVDFFLGLKLQTNYLSTTQDSFEHVLKTAGVIDIINARELVAAQPSYAFAHSLLLKEDGTFFECRWVKDVFGSVEDEWESFKCLKQKSKEIILDTLKDMSRPGMLVRYNKMHIEDYTNQIAQKKHTPSAD